MKLLLLIIFSIFLISCEQSGTTSDYHPCNSNPCAESSVPHKVICVPNGDDYSCTCESPYKEDDGGRCVEDQNANTACDPNPCTEENTECQLYNKLATCVCKDGYSLDSNNKCAATNPCKADSCTEANKTICAKASNTRFECLCDPGFSINSSGTCVAATYGSYYSSINDSLNNTDLINALHTIIKDHRSISYGAAGDKLDDIDGRVCSYTNLTGLSLNVEHVWPQSYFGEASPMKSDLHHLRNVSSYVNSKRGNVHFGEVIKTDCKPNCYDNCTYDDNCAEDESCCYFCDWDGSLRDGIETDAKKGKPSTNCNDHSIFEPADSVKGDVARALFYFAVRYKDKQINQSQSYMTGPGELNHIPSYEEKYLRIWHLQDPVSYDEIQRNNAIEDIQNNRNPFIDRPDLVQRISDF